MIYRAQSTEYRVQSTEYRVQSTDLASEAVSGSLGDHGGPPGGGLAVVDHAGEILTLIKLYPLDVHLASYQYNQC